LPSDLKIFLNFFNKNLFIISFIAQLNPRGYSKKLNKSKVAPMILEKNKLIKQIDQRKKLQDIANTFFSHSKFVKV